MQIRGFGLLCRISRYAIDGHVYASGCAVLRRWTHTGGSPRSTTVCTLPVVTVPFFFFSVLYPLKENRLKKKRKTIGRSSVFAQAHNCKKEGFILDGWTFRRNSTVSLCSALSAQRRKMRKDASPPTTCPCLTVDVYAGRQRQKPKRKRRRARRHPCVLQRQRMGERRFCLLHKTSK